MKTLFLFLLPVMAVAQHNFTIDNGKIEWSKIEYSDTSPEAVLEDMKRSGRFQGLTLSNGSIFGSFQNAALDYRGAGKSTGSTSMYISSSNLNGSFVIDFKEGRRRTKVSNMKLVENVGILRDANSISDLEDYSITRKGEMRSGFEKKDVGIFEHSLSQIFDFNTDNDW